MENYLKYLENDSFVDWVYNKNPEAILFWENYIEENPEEKDLIFSLKSILLNIKPEEAILSKEEKNEVFTKLIHKIESRNSKPKVYTLVRKSYKYAAVLFFALLAGAFLLKNNSNNKNRHVIERLTQTSIDSFVDTQLFLGKEKPLVINKKESFINNRVKGEIVLNGKDTLANYIISENQELEYYNKLIVPYGRRSKIVLSDGTIVHLNAGTKFMYPDYFSSKKRTVFLSGEAFFEVASNKEKPFVVKTIEDKLEVEVLGTKFNVSAYETDDNIKTVLTEGRVNVLEHKIFGAKRTALKPGELALWNIEEESISVKTVNTDNYTLWTSGLLYFESEYVSNIVKKIERFYNVNIVFDEAVKGKNITISGKLDLNDKINKTLENLTITTDFKFEVINEKNYILK